ncbi:MAG: hypothetical protein GX752_03520 [Clostridium sp.]|nr:hypothetical protein [Clostridium sp.]
MSSKILTLTKVMFKNDETMDAMMGGSSKKKTFFNNKIMKGLLFLFLLVIIAFSMTVFTIDIYGELEVLSIQTLIPKLAFPAASLFVFIFGIFYVMNIFYFSDDVKNYLYLPVKAGDIITAKFFTSLIYQYIIIGMLFLPVFITYGYLSSAGILYYILLLISFVFLPILPISIASILSILVMRFSKGAKNKDRFNLIAGVFALIFAIGTNVTIQFFASKATGDGSAGLILTEDIALIKILNTLFPSSYFSANALINANNVRGPLYVLVLIGISIFSIFIFNIIGNRFYFEGVVGIQESGAKRDTVSEEKLVKSVKSRNKMFSYSLKELRILLRTPVFFLNNVLMSFIFPILILVPFIMGVSQIDSFELQAILEFAGQIDKSIILLSLIGLAFFLGSNNGIAATSISKEGKGFYFMKYIPMPYIDQLYSKILVALFIQFIPLTILFIIISVVLKLDILFIIISFFIMLLASLMQNQIAIIFDIMWPKLDWDTEQKAVKQNLNFVFQMLLGFVLAGLTIFILIKFDPTYFVAVMASTIILAILIGLLHFLLIKLANAKFKSY